jgi:2,4-dienoyl-CoA reductase-like NADH-dependent reductase (Old Yellow Enzyme family)
MTLRDRDPYEADDIDLLFEPFEYKSLRLPNRLVMSSMTRYFSPDGAPTEEVAAYYTRRAAGGAGLIITEGIAPDREVARSQEDIPWFNGHRRDPWRKVVDDVHLAGGKIAPQIWHVGGARDLTFPDSPLGEHLESPSGFFGSTMIPSRPMTEEDIADAIASFVRAAVDAKALGFDAVEFHGAHGFTLFDQYFWGVTNKRTDSYGGPSIADRSRFAVEAIRAIRKEIGDDFVLLLRISQWKQNDWTAKLGADPHELAEWVEPLASAGVDIFDCSQRRFWEPEFEGSDLNFAGWVKKLTGQPTVTVGSIGLATDLMTDFDLPSNAVSAPTPSTIRGVAERLQKGEFDLVAVGRAMLADPEWCSKVRDRRFGELTGYSVDMGKTLF